MLQVDIVPFASDALEEAMSLAQTKSLNSYSFSDCMNFLNYVWSDIYAQMATVDSGFYSKTVRLTQALTKLPRFVKNSIMVYSAQRPNDGSLRTVYTQSRNSDFRSTCTYHISGMDLLCPDAERTTVWLEYVPHPPQLFFTHHNRDPKIYPDGHDTVRNRNYQLWTLENDRGVDISSPDVTGDDIAGCARWFLRHKNRAIAIPDTDLTDFVVYSPNGEEGMWQLRYISCDYPYIFCSYMNELTGEWKSGFFDRNMEWTSYNPFEWTGRNDNVEYLECHYNDKTGMGVVVRDWNEVTTRLLNIDKLPSVAGSIIHVQHAFEYKAADGVAYKFSTGYWFNRFATDYNYEKVMTGYPENPDAGDVVLVDGNLLRYDGTAWHPAGPVNEVAQEETVPVIKELGWTPDTKLVYPDPVVYRYLVARLAEKFASLNESNIMGVQSELADARFAFHAFLKKDKSSWERIRNVTPATITDWL